MIFSVYDPLRRIFVYFDAPGTARDYGARGTKHRPLTAPPSGSAAVGLIGFSAEALALPLPASARPVGFGADAKGIVAVLPQTLAAQRAASPPSPVLGSPKGVAIGGLAGVDVGVPALAVPEPTRRSALPELVFAACVASVVGVFVQKALR